MSLKESQRFENLCDWLDLLFLLAMVAAVACREVGPVTASALIVL
jgi:hypothetical protein